jgi:hypothetical protein
MAMRPSQFKDFMKKSLVMMPRRAIFVAGPVGVGKSECTAQVVEELGFEMRDIRLSLLDATDLRGLPTIDKDKKETVWTKPTFLPPEDYDKDVLLFFDEFNTANKSMQNACLQLMLDRQIGEYKLPERTRVMCAGNRLQDGGFVSRLSSAMNNRFVHIEFEPNLDDWKVWAYKKKVNPLIVGYHNYTKGEHLHNYKEDVDNKAFASPRTWYFTHEILAMGLENGTLYEALKGTIGEGAGSEFYGYMKIYKDLPKPADILEKGKDILPKDSNIAYALVSALINHVLEKKEYIHRLIQYSLKLQKEFSVVLVKDLLKTELKNETVSSPSFDSWVKENKDVVL